MPDGTNLLILHLLMPDTSALMLDKVWLKAGPNGYELQGDPFSLCTAAGMRGRILYFFDRDLYGIPLMAHVPDARGRLVRRTFFWLFAELAEVAEGFKRGMHWARCQQVVKMSIAEYLISSLTVMTITKLQEDEAFAEAELDELLEWQMQTLNVLLVMRPEALTAINDMYGENGALKGKVALLSDDSAVLMEEHGFSVAYDDYCLLPQPDPNKGGVLRYAVVDTQPPDADVGHWVQ